MLNTIYNMVIKKIKANDLIIDKNDIIWNGIRKERYR